MGLLGNGFALVLLLTVFEYFHLQTSPMNLLIPFVGYAAMNISPLFGVTISVFAIYKAYEMYKTQNSMMKYYLFIYVAGACLILKDIFPNILR